MIKKKINIALLIIVLGLWGTVVYKYVSHFFLSTEVQVFESQNNLSVNLKNSVKDTFELKTLTRDPFLGLSNNKSTKIIINQSNNSKKSIVKNTPSSIIKEPFPRIIYYGHILSNEKKKEMILLNVRGKFLKLALNEEKEKIKVTTFTRDSIKVSFGKEFQWFYLKK